MFSIYRSTPDAQSPERERSFLRKAQELAFSAIVIEASPIAPVNTDFFRRMRSDGMKVIHLSPYIDDMSAECAFLPDFRSAGLLAAVKAALAGYESITFFPADRRRSAGWSMRESGRLRARYPLQFSKMPRRHVIRKRSGHF